MSIQFKRAIYLLITFLVVLEILFLSFSVLMGSTTLSRKEGLGKRLRLGPLAPSRKEVITKRTANTRTFLNKDRTFTTEVYANPIHYRDPKGQWRRANPSLKSPKATKVPYKVTFLTAPEFIFKTRWMTTRIFPQKVGLVSGTISENEVFYQDVWPDADLKYITGSQGIKQQIILRAPFISPQFTFGIDSGKVPQKLGKSLDFYFFILTQPLAYDRTGNIVPVNFTYNSSKKILGLNLDSKWQAQAKYPVIIELNLMLRTSGGKDAFIAKAPPYDDLNFGSTSRLNLAENHPSLGEVSSFIQFDLSGIPKNIRINDAALALYVKEKFDVTRTVKIFLVKEEWNNFLISYENQPRSRKVEIASSKINFRRKGWYWFRGDLKEEIQKWIEEPENNFGIMIFPSSSNNSSQISSFVSSDDFRNPTFWPKLEINYQIP